VLAASVANQQTYLAHCESWAPPPNGTISLETVRQAIIAAHGRFRLDGLFYDPFQCALMAEQLAGLGIPMYPVPFTPTNLDAMARALLSAFRDRSIHLYRDPDLLRDLSRLSIVERPAGFRLHATRDQHGHCDRATAFAIGLPAAMEWARQAMYALPLVNEDHPELFLV
jgi:phage terminase large subunit-like protein